MYSAIRAICNIFMDMNPTWIPDSDAGIPFFFSYLFHYICHDRIIYLCITDDVSSAVFLKLLLLVTDWASAYECVLCLLLARTLSGPVRSAFSVRWRSASRRRTAPGRRRPCPTQWTVNFHPLWLLRWWGKICIVIVIFDRWSSLA